MKMIRQLAKKLPGLRSVIQERNNLYHENASLRRELEGRKKSDLNMQGGLEAPSKEKFRVSLFPTDRIPGLKSNL